MTLVRIGLKQQRTGLIAITVMSVVAGVLNALAFVQVVGTSQADRLAFAQQMQVVVGQLSYMLPLPERLETLAGYLQWRAFGALVLIFGVWAVISATGSGRGDEERGLVEQWLAAGAGRARYLATRVLVFTAVAVFAIATTVVLTYLACFGFGLVIAQLVTTRRAAGGMAAGLVIALFLFNGASRTADVGPVRWLSPFYLYERSRPLTNDGALDLFAIVLLVI